MGDRVERARAWRGVGVGAACALLALLATTALLFLIPTEGENPRAWGVIVCGVVTVVVCARLARRNWLLLRHFRGDDLPPARGARPERRHPSLHTMQRTQRTRRPASQRAAVHRQPLHH